MVVCKLELFHKKFHLPPPPFQNPHLLATLQTMYICYIFPKWQFFRNDPLKTISPKTKHYKPDREHLNVLHRTHKRPQISEGLQAPTMSTLCLYILKFLFYLFIQAEYLTGFSVPQLGYFPLI